MQEEGYPFARIASRASAANGGTANEMLFPAATCLSVKEAPVFEEGVQVVKDALIEDAKGLGGGHWRGPCTGPFRERCTLPAWRPAPPKIPLPSHPNHVFSVIIRRPYFLSPLQNFPPGAI